MRSMSRTDGFIVMTSFRSAHFLTLMAPSRSAQLLLLWTSLGSAQLLHLQLELKEMLVLHVRCNVFHRLRKLEEVLHVVATGTLRLTDLRGNLLDVGWTKVVRVVLRTDINVKVERCRLVYRVERDANHLIAALLSIVEVLPDIFFLRRWYFVGYTPNFFLEITVRS